LTFTYDMLIYYPDVNSFCAPIAQLEESSAENGKVDGSIPSRGTKKYRGKPHAFRPFFFTEGLYYLYSIYSKFSLLYIPLNLPLLFSPASLYLGHEQSQYHLSKYQNQLLYKMVCRFHLGDDIACLYFHCRQIHK
jgi:hypothetical protein